MKRFLLIVLSLLLCVQSALTVYAAETADNTVTYTVNDENFTSDGLYTSTSDALKGPDGTYSKYGSADSSAKWEITAPVSGYYKVYFYNIKYSNNCAGINVKVNCGDSEKSYSISHYSGNAECGYTELGGELEEYTQGDKIIISVSASNSADAGFIRLHSVKLEFYKYDMDYLYGTDDFTRTTTNWYSGSSLTGYEGSTSIFASGNSEQKGYWGMNLRKSGIADVYFYNIKYSSNCSKANVTFYSNDGTPHVTEVTHNGSYESSGLVYLGRFEFSGDGKEYVEVSNSSGGMLRINTLLVKFYSSDFSQNSDSGEYAQRELSEKSVSLYNPASNAKHIYVSPGEGEGSGTKTNPYKSISQAQTAVRNLIKAGYNSVGIVVNLMEGNYSLDDTLTFTSADSGSTSYPVLWQADGNVTFTTSTGFMADEFIKVEDEAVLARIPDKAESKVYKKYLGDINSESMNVTSPYIVTFDDKLGTLSRWPNTGFEYLGDIVDIGTRSDSGLRQRGFTYKINNEHILRWKNEPNAWMNGYWLTAYTNEFVKIADIDLKNLTISSLGGTSLGAYENPRFMALNMMCELDSEGEWYIEDDNLYVVMPDGCEKINIAYKTSGILNITTAQNVIYRNINFDACNSVAVTIGSSAVNCGIEGGSIKNTSSTGIKISGTNSYVRDCDISYTGGKGIDISGGNQYRLYHGGNYAENCKVSKTGRCTSQKSGIAISGCGNRISNCHIYDIPTQGIIGSGMENTIEKNIIERTNLEISDTGGIYFLEYGMGYGSKIRYNIIRDSVGLNQIDGYSNEGALGIYLDDMTSGVEVFGNIVYNVKEPAIFCHGGRYITVDNNIVIKCDESISVVKTSIGKNLSLDGVSAQNIRNYNNQTINSRYPQAVGALSDDFGNPKYNKVTDNIVYNSSAQNTDSVTKYSGTVSGNAHNNFMPDSDCVDFYDLDFDEIRKQISGFEDIPVAEIGIYNGGLRTEESDVIFDNRCEEFNITEPADKSTDIDRDVTLKWETNDGGIQSSRVYISENADMSDAKIYVCRDSMLELSLDYGKTYYWRVVNVPFLGYSSKTNTNGIFSFTTMSCEDKLKSLEKSIEFLIDYAEEAHFEMTSGELEAELERFKSCTDFETALETGENAIGKMLASKKPTGLTETAIYDSYSLDTVGEAPYGLFLRSFSTINIETANVPVKNSVGVKISDTDTASYQYTARYFYPEEKYIEFSTKVVPVQTNGVFSMNIAQTGKHITRDGVLSGNAARITFNSDGYIYADKSMEYRMIKYSANTVYAVKICMDIENGTYDVYINENLTAQNVPVNSDDIESVGSITYDTTNGTADLTAKGVFYIDDTVVRTPAKFGRSSYIEELYADGKVYNPENTVILTDTSNPETAEISVVTGENAKYKISSEEGKVYITVLSADFDSINTYCIK